MAKIVALALLCLLGINSSFSDNTANAIVIKNQNLASINGDGESGAGEESKGEEKQKEKSKKPVDKIEASEQPEDNDDDEKLSDNHIKMSKIIIKKSEIKKLVSQHNHLTQDALKQYKSGSSKKKSDTNLKIAKKIAKRVEDLKQQILSDEMQITPIKNAAVADENHPFKSDMQPSDKNDVAHIPSVQNSGTGQRHPYNDATIAIKEHNMIPIDQETAK